jgi:hypothetical protein
MAISTTTHKRLWQRCGNRCAKCRGELHEDATAYDDPSILGQECHIVGDKPGSARFNDPLPQEQRHLYHNLIILCTECHKIVDDQESTYSVDYLRQLKAEHEQWVRETLGPGDPAKERDEVTYANIIDEWCRRADLEHWKATASNVLSDGQPKVLKEDYDRFQELASWLFSRVWPHRYPELRAAFENFTAVLHDFLTIFAKYADTPRHDNSLLETEKFYKRGGFVSNDEFDLRLKRFYHHVEIVEDLFLELTRASNYICDRVRETISPTFRLNEGVIIVSYGTLTLTQERPEYYGDERTNAPYPGLTSFYVTREHRDSHFGTGPPPSE